MLVQSWIGKIPWRNKWQPIPVFLPGKSHGQRSLAGYSPQGQMSQTQLKQLSIALDLQKSCRYITEFPHMLYPPSPNSNILYNHSTFVKTRKLSVVKYYQLNHRVYVIFTSFFPNDIFSFQDPIQNTHCIQSLVSSSFPSLFHSVNFSSCWVMTLTTYFVKWPSVWVSLIFPQVKLILSSQTYQSLPL